MRLVLMTFLTAVFVSLTGSLSAETIARCGKGWLEEIDGYPVLHLKGTPWEMGYQHGALMKEQIRKNLHNLLVAKAGSATVEVGPLKVTPRVGIEMIIKIQEPYVDPRYFEELDGLAAGAGISVADARVANFIPELFHCSGFALSGTATENGRMLHGRVLDYAIDWGLQEHIVLIVAEPEGRIPFVNVTYAGFTGCVTGMNAEKVSVGEMGGGGLGHWEGRPMSLLLRDVLETSDSLDKAISVFRDGPRTCQYFYVVADGETNKAVGMEASWDVFTLIQPNQAHDLLPRPVPDCVLLSAGDRYQELVNRAVANHGKFTPELALRLMDRPVAMKSNLHNALFEPETGRLWIANASADKKPAAEQPYHAFSLPELLAKKPTSDSPELPMATRTAAK
ncbi:MAG: peptidase C45 [Planctomycetaceae bacterium]|nr:peptidase C45 [Planctomycetaceae bacterium]